MTPADVQDAMESAIRDQVATLSSTAPLVFDNEDEENTLPRVDVSVSHQSPLRLTYRGGQRFRAILTLSVAHRRGVGGTVPRALARSLAASFPLDAEILGATFGKMRIISGGEIGPQYLDGETIWRTPVVVIYESLV